MKNIALMAGILITATGCASILFVSPEGVKAWPNDKIYAAQSDTVIPMEGSIGYKNKGILRQEIVSRNPEWPEDVKNAVLQGTLVIGMTKEQVMASWGTPHTVKTTTTKAGVNEQWVYSQEEQSCYGGMVHCANYRVPVMFAYMENGKLASWQN